MSAKQKRKKITKEEKKLIRSIVITLLIGIGLIIWASRDDDNNEAFGVSTPKYYTICGIDVSRYQEKIDWEKVAKTRSGKDSLAISFAFIKATEGKTLKDPQFIYNWENAKKNNILIGAYHYYKPNINSKLQADNFMATVELEKGDFPPVLDIEETGRFGNDNMRQGIKNWLNIIEKHYGVKPIIYCYVDFYERILKTDDFKDYPFWIAHYYENELRVKEKWHFWQHSDKARVDGIQTKVDLNVFNGTFKDLKKLCKQ